MKHRIIGALLDATTLTTCAILVTIACAGITDPTIAESVIPLMLTTFAVTLTSGTAKIVLNHKTRKRNNA